MGDPRREGKDAETVSQRENAITQHAPVAQADNNPLQGLSNEAKRTMERLLRTPPEPQKDTAKPGNCRAEAQRRRRERERQPSTEASSTDP